jgi:catechol 2,3-dioxygenase-like lactoylglutathione lyase family enzyme
MAEEECSMFLKAESIALFVHDLARCTAFYRDTIAFPLKGSDPGLAAFDLPGGVMLVLLSPEGAAEVVGTHATALTLEGGSRGYVAISVEDVNDTYADLQAKGVTFVQSPTDKLWGLRMAHFTDPEGNLWEITQEIDATPQVPQ